MQLSASSSRKQGMTLDINGPYPHNVLSNPIASARSCYTTLGSIITRIWILDPGFYGEPVLPRSHFVSSLRASLQFAHRIYAEANTDAKLQLRCAVLDAQGLDLLVRSALNPRAGLQNRDVGRRNTLWSLSRGKAPWRA